MKSSRMNFAKKLKSMRAGEYLKQDRILKVLSGADEFLPKITAASSSMIWRSPPIQEASGNEENMSPPVNQIPRDSFGSDRKSFGCGFRRPELNSTTLFDPKLLEAFELAVRCFRRVSSLDDDEDVIVFPAEEEERGKDIRIVNGTIEPQLGFEERCPPGGEESVVFYTTTLRGIRKTFDDCNMIRFLLDSFKLKYYERDVSMHRHYRDELRRISSAQTEVLPPLLFVKGRCIGGAQSVLALHEQGLFRALFDGLPIAGDKPCRRCDGFRFLMCDGCRGSRRVLSTDGSWIQCLLCNENGLIVCLDCS